MLLKQKKEASHKTGLPFCIKLFELKINYLHSD